MLRSGDNIRHRPNETSPNLERGVRMFNAQDQYAELNRLQQRASSGARWFYWIAALSLFNSIVYLSGSK